MRAVLYLGNRFQALFEARRKVRQIWEHRGPLAEVEVSQIKARHVLVVADLIEEEYRLEHLPHLTGSDHRALVARKRRQIFQDEPFVAVTKLGREAQGRRDDLLLFSAIRDSGAFNRCLKKLAEHEIDVQGIWSLPRLSQDWCKAFPALSEGLWVWLYPMADRVALRQSYCRNGKVLFSRLSLVAETDLTREAMEEMDRTYRYLVRLLRIPTDQVLKVNVVCLPEFVPVFQELAGEIPGFELRPLDLSEYAAKLGWRGDPSRISVPALAVANLGRRWLLVSHYQNHWQRRFQRQRRLRLALYGATAAMVLTSCAYGAYAWQEGRRLKQEMQRLHKQNATLGKLLEQQPGIGSIQGYDPWQIETAMDLKQQLDTRRIDPEKLLAPVGAVLARFPGLALKSLAWQRRPFQEESMAADAFVGEPIEMTLDLRVSEISQGHLRQAVDEIRRFIGQVEKMPGIETAAIVKSPLPTHPESTVSGEAGLLASFHQDATFKVMVRFGEKTGVD